MIEILSDGFDQMTVTLDYEQFNLKEVELLRHIKVQQNVFPIVTVRSSKPIIRNANRKSYSSYINSEYSRSRNIIMNELSTDIGYPQQVLINGKSTMIDAKPDKNYLRLNIKKIGEYGLEPGRANSFQPYKEPPKYDPTHILNFKIEQNSLKALTRIALDKDIKVPLSTRSARKLQRMEAALQLNDKVLEIRQTYSGSNTQREQRPRPNDSVHRFTQSFVMKRSLTNKKKAYVEVFGDDTGAVTLSIDHKSIDAQKTSRKALTRNQIIAAHKSKVANDTLKFQQTLSKLGVLDKVFNGTVDKKIIDAKIQKQIQDEHNAQKQQKTQQDQMLSQVYAFAKRDKEKKLANAHQKLASLEDLSRIDPQFCQEFKRHKQHKVFKMKCQLELNSVMSSPRPPIELRSRQSFDKMRKSSLQISIQEDNTINQQNPPLKKQPSRRSCKYMTRYQKTQHFLKKFFGIKQDGDKFGIPTQYMYYALYTRPAVYEIEGSYLFFRAIQQHDVKTIQTMIKMKPIMVFQRDDEGRTPLIYAAQKNLNQIVKLLMKIGVNQDANSYREVNALYYAIRNKNLKMAFELIYAGASPWSPPGSDFNTLIKGAEQQPFKALLQLARRISITVKLSKYSTRLKLWQSQREQLKKLYQSIR